MPQVGLDRIESRAPPSRKGRGGELETGLIRRQDVPDVHRSIHSLWYTFAGFVANAFESNEAGDKLGCAKNWFSSGLLDQSGRKRLHSCAGRVEIETFTCRIASGAPPQG